MTTPATDSAPLEARLAGLADIVKDLIEVVTRLDDETSATAAANFNPDVPRVAGHPATAEKLQTLSSALSTLLK